MEYMTFENIMAIASTLLIVGVLIGKTSYRLGLPMLLIFLIVGMIFGIDGIGVQFSDMRIAQYTGMVALCIILFTGGMGTKISSIRPIIAPGLILSTAGVLLTAMATGLFIWWLSGMKWTNIHFPLITSLLLASTMSSTDSASVFGILGSRKVYLRHNLRPMLELESGSNDPMAYMLTIILIEVITMGSSLSAGKVLLELVLQFGVGSLAGFLAGKATLWLIGLYRQLGGQAQAQSQEDPAQSASMITIMVVGCVFLTFIVTSSLGGNGYLAVYLCGIVIGNAKFQHRRGIGKLLDGLTWLAQTVVFLMLGLLVNPHEMLDVAAVSLLIGIFMIAVGRPLSVFLSLAPLRKVCLKSKLFVSWVGLRGAVPIIFATYPVVAGVEGASQIFNIVFFVTLVSLLVQGTTIIPVARKLGLITDPGADSGEFGVELDEELPTSLQTMILDEHHLANGNTLSAMHLPEGALVMMIKRGNSYIVPNGSRKLHPGDILLIIKEDPAQK